MYIGSTFIFNQVHWLNFHLQPVIHVETKLMKVDDQCVSMLIQCWCVPWFPATLDNCVLVLQHEVVWPPHQILLAGTIFLKLREILSVRHTTTDYFWLCQRTLLEFWGLPRTNLIGIIVRAMTKHSLRCIKHSERYIGLRWFCKHLHMSYLGV